MEPNSLKVCNYDLTPKQHASFISFQKQVQSKAQDIFGKTPEKIPFYTSEDHLIRLLVAREFNEKKAFEMWVKWVDWRLEFKVDSMKESDIEVELRSGKAFWHKYDKKKHPCLVVKTKRHYPSQTDVETMMKFAVHLIETGTKEADKIGDGKVCVLWDRKGFTMKNFDKRFLGLIKKLSGVLQDNYAERLDCIYILYPNWFFRTMFKILSPFLTQRTKDKMKIINSYKDLEKHFDSDCVLKEMGGTSSFVYKYKDVVIDDSNANDITNIKETEDDEELKKVAKNVMKEEGVASDSD